MLQCMLNNQVPKVQGQLDRGEGRASGDASFGEDGLGGELSHDKVPSPCIRAEAHPQDVLGIAVFLAAAQSLVRSTHSKALRRSQRRSPAHLPLALVLACCRAMSRQVASKTCRPEAVLTAGWLRCSLAHSCTYLALAREYKRKTPRNKVMGLRPPQGLEMSTTMQDCMYGGMLPALSARYSMSASACIPSSERHAICLGCHPSEREVDAGKDLPASLNSFVVMAGRGVPCMSQCGKRLVWPAWSACHHLLQILAWSAKMSEGIVDDPLAVSTGMGGAYVWGLVRL